MPVRMAGSTKDLEATFAAMTHLVHILQAEHSIRAGPGVTRLSVVIDEDQSFAVRPEEASEREGDSNGEHDVRVQIEELRTTELWREAAAGLAEPSSWPSLKECWRASNPMSSSD